MEMGEHCTMRKWEEIYRYSGPRLRGVRAMEASCTRARTIGRMQVAAHVIYLRGGL